jgi:hypothetical protein
MPVFTRASSVFIPVVPAHISRQRGAVHDNPLRLYGVPLKFDRNASADLRGRPPLADAPAAVAAVDAALRRLADPSRRAPRPRGWSGDFRLYLVASIGAAQP